MTKAYTYMICKQMFSIFLVLLTAWNVAFSQPEKVIINEINYRSVRLQQNIDFIELYNAGNVAINLTGWQITNGISYKFPSGTTINPRAYLVIAANPSTCQSVFGFSGALGPYTGKLSSDGETVELRDQNFCKLHKVDYESWQEWPAVRYRNDGDSPASIQKINPELPGQHGGSWSAATPTPKAANSSVFRSNASQIPVVKSVSKTPDKPNSGEVVRIKADLTNIDALSGTLSVVLDYQVVEPGDYIHKSDSEYVTDWTSIAMLDNGIGADSTANNGVFTVAIPSNIQEHRNLIRYRVKVSTPSGFNKTFPDQRHGDSNYAYYVYDDYPTVGNYNINTLNPMQDFTIITDDDTADEYIGPGNGEDNDGQYSGSSFRGEGTLVYNGKVYDHIRFRPRGRSNGRGDRYKPALKFDMNNEHTFAPLDECGNEYDEKRTKITLSGTYMNDIATHGFTESIVHKILRLMGAMGRGTEYTQFRIVDEDDERDDFWGVFLIMEGYDKAFLRENNYPEGNIWRHKSHRLTYQGDFPNSGNYEWEEDESTLDWDLVLADKAANMFLGNGASNYEGKHSQRDYYNSETGKWHVWYGDYDTTFGMSSDNDTYHERRDSEYDEDINLVQDLDGKETEFKNVMRSAYDLLFSQEQINYLIDVESAKIRDANAPYDWTDLDRYRWDQDYDLGNIDDQLDWYRDWFEDRSDFLENDNDDGFESSRIPNKPVISLTGSTALDNLTFSNSNFSDPQGSTSFEALEWRVGEWSDPSNSYYQGSCKAKYEIESVWESGELSSFSNSFTIPGTANLEAGRTYKIRVRYKDSSDRWSHWSNAIKLIPTAANNNNAAALVINEIMYNPSEKCDNEYIELKNAGTGTIILDGYSFTDGIDYRFPIGTSLAAGGLIVIAKDSINFYQKYGFQAFGDYAGSLKDGGERLVLSDLHHVLVDSLSYTNDSPWNELADGTGYSLVLLDASSDNADPENWCLSDIECGSPGSENIQVCPSAIDPQVFQAYGINITGVGYNIADSTGVENENLEFLFMTNFGTQDRVVAGDSIFQGITFTFPAGTIIAAGETVMITKDLTKYPDVNMTKYIWVDGKLKNGGEQVAYKNAAGDIINDFTYDDIFPWPVEADGAGFYLQLLASHLDNRIPENWEAVPVASLGELCCPDLDGDGLCDVDDECVPSITQSGNFVITQSEFARDNITSDGIIESGSDIEFTAADNILLTANFEVKSGAVFHAYIQACTN